MLSPIELAALRVQLLDDFRLANALFEHFLWCQSKGYEGAYLPQIATEIAQHDTGLTIAIRTRVQSLLARMTTLGLIEWTQNDHNQESLYRVLSPLGRRVHADRSYIAMLFHGRFINEVAIPALWFLEATNAETKEVGQATSFYIGGEWFVTCKHCFEPPNVLMVVDLDVRDHPRYAITRTLAHPTLDIAAFQSPGVPVTTNLNIEPHRPALIDPVTVLHCPRIPLRIATKVATTGEVNAIVKDYATGDEHLLISARTSPGSSGGPILNLRGHVCGLAAELTWVSRSSDPEGTLDSFYHAVPGDEVFEFLHGHGLV